MLEFEFGNRLSVLRKAAGLSQTQLGERLHVTNKAVSKWENGRAMPGLDIVRQEKQVHRRSKYANLSVKAMKDYISCMRNSDERLAELDSVVSASRGQDHPIRYTREWFLENYPGYNSIPVFDEEGYLLPKAAIS